MTTERGFVSSRAYNVISNNYTIQGVPIDFGMSHNIKDNKWEGFTFVNNLAQIAD
jgi:hypothetical protein